MTQQVTTERADALYDWGRYAHAEMEYRNYLTTKPESSYAHRMLAFCLLYQGKNIEALDESAKAVETGPGDAWSHYCRAFILKETNKYKEAEHSMAEVLRLDPENDVFHVEAAHLALVQGKNDDALKYSERALALNPLEYKAHLYKAWALYGQDKLEECDGLIAEVLRLKPDCADAHSLKGWIYFQKRRTTESICEFRECLRMSPLDSTAREGLLKALGSRNPLFGVLAFSMGVTPWALIRPLAFGSIGVLVFIAALFLLFAGALARPILKLCMRYDPIAKGALDEEEIQAATKLGIMLLIAYVGTIVMLLTCMNTRIFAPAFFLLYGIPFLLSRFYEFPDGVYRKRYFLYIIVAITVGALAVLCSFFPDSGLPSAISSVPYFSMYLGYTFLLMCILSRFLYAAHARTF